MTIIINSNNPEPLLAAFHERFPDQPATAATSYNALYDLIPTLKPTVVYAMRFDAVTPYPRDILLSSEGPQWIAVGGSGIDHLGQWDTRQVTITNTAGVASGMMAEYVLGCFLHFSLDIPGLQRDKSNHFWQLDRVVQPLFGKTVLIVGLGKTGREIAKRAKAFGMHVIGTRANPQPTDNVYSVHGADELHHLFPQADFITVCTPRLDSTKHIIDSHAFDAMKSSAIFTDVSRGGVVDQQALVQALTLSKIKAAASDVFEQEPMPVDNRLWECPNLLISPHCSSVYDGWEDASFKFFLDNFERFLSGQALHNIVDPIRGY